MNTVGILHLPSWLQKSLNRQEPTRVDFAESGFVSVFPEQQLFASNIQDWDNEFLWSQDDAQVSVLPDDAASMATKPLPELQWRMTFLAVENAPLDDVQYRVFRLASWPSIAHMPEETQSAAARICALLSRRHSSAFLIPQILGLEKELTLKVLKALQLTGYIQAAPSSARPDAQSEAESAVQTDTPEQRGRVEVTPSANTFLEKLWHRLNPLQLQPGR